MSNAIANLQPADFAAAMQTLPPRGDALPRDPNALFSTLLAALSGRMAAAHAHAGLLSEVESDPRQTTLLLPNWEACFGLPDPCLGVAPDYASRRAQLVARIGNRGKTQNASVYIQYAAALGYTITITTFKLFRAGSGRAGQNVRGPIWGYTWQINAPSVTMKYFRAGSGAAGDPLRSFNAADLLCEMRRLTPAHTNLIFLFAPLTGPGGMNFSLVYNSQYVAIF